MDSPYYRPPFTKVKLTLSYEDEKPLFRLFDKKGDQKEEIELVTFKDVVEHMRFLTKHRMIVQFQKLYAMKTSSGSEKRKYGITLKLVAVECTNKPGHSTEKNSDLFIDEI